MKQSFTNFLRIIGVTIICFSVDLNASEDWSSSYHFLIGQKILEDNDWGPIAHQPEIGISFDYKGDDWPMSVATDWLISYDDGSESGVDYTGLTSELQIGLRKYFKIENSDWLTFIGAGTSFIYASQDIDFGNNSFDDSDTGVGYFLNGGFLWQRDNLHLGVDIRISRADADLFGIDTNVGGDHIAFSFGWAH